MMFDANGKRYVAAAGKEGMLHVVNRDDGKLDFKLPMTTMLNHDVPLTAEGVRVCPVAGVQWNGPAFSPKPDDVNAIDGARCSSLDRSEYRHSSLYRAHERIWHERSVDRRGWINARSIPRPGRRAGASRAHTHDAALTPTASNVLLPATSTATLRWMRDGKLYSFDTGGPIAGGIVTYEQYGKHSSRLPPAAAAARSRSAARDADSANDRKAVIARCKNRQDAGAGAVRSFRHCNRLTTA